MTNKIEHYKTLISSLEVDKEPHYRDWEYFYNLEFDFSPDAPDALSPYVLLSMMARVKGRGDIYKILKRATARFTAQQGNETEEDYTSRIIASYIPLQYKLNAIVESGSADKLSHLEAARKKTLIRTSRMKEGYQYSIKTNKPGLTIEEYINYLEAHYPIDAAHNTYNDDLLMKIALSGNTYKFMRSNSPKRWDLLMFFYTRINFSYIAVLISKRFLEEMSQIWPCDKHEDFSVTMDNVAERVEYADIPKHLRDKFYHGYDTYFKKRDVA